MVLYIHSQNMFSDEIFYSSALNEFTIVLNREKCQKACRLFFEFILILFRSQAGLLFEYFVKRGL